MAVKKQPTPEVEKLTSVYLKEGKYLQGDRQNHYQKNLCQKKSFFIMQLNGEKKIL